MKLFLALFLVAVIAAYSNPDATQHALHLKEGQQRLRLEDKDFLGFCEFHDFTFFSLTVYLGNTVSVGFFGNVFVQYDELDQSLRAFKAEQTLMNSQPIIGVNGDLQKKSRMR